MLAVERIKSQLAVYKRAAADGMVNPENVRRIKALRTQLAVLDHTRVQLQRPSTNYASVRGFDFPLASGDEVERLEQSVRQDRQVRAEFVSTYWWLGSEQHNLENYITGPVSSDEKLYPCRLGRLLRPVFRRFLDGELQLEWNLQPSVPEASHENLQYFHRLFPR